MNSRLRFGAVVLVTAVTLSACNFDLSLPERPQRGAVTGAVDTQGRLENAGLDVVLVDESGSQRTQKTDATAAFTFSDLLPGVYFLELKLPGFAPFVRPNIRVKAGETVDLGAVAPQWLQGTAAERTLSGRVNVEGGVGSASGGQVEFTLQGQTKAIAIATIGLEGEFVQRLPPGVYGLRAKHPKYTDATTTVTLTATNDEELPAPLVLGLDPATITGRVFMERDGNTPVAAQGVVVALATGSATDTTDSNGDFTLSNIPAGDHRLTFTLAGFHSAALERNVTVGKAQTLALTPHETLLIDRGNIEGQVELQDTNANASEVRVSVNGTTYAAAVVPDATEGFKGSFRITAVPVNSYSVKAELSGFTTVVRPNVNVVKDGTAVVSPSMSLLILGGDLTIDDGDATSATGYVNRRAVTLKLANATGAARYRVDVDENFANAPTFQNLPGTDIPWTIPAQVSDGPFTVHLQYQDSNGTPSRKLMASAVLDTTAPTGSVLINGGAAYTNAPANIVLTLNASDASAIKDVVLGETLDANGDVVGTATAYLVATPFQRTSTVDGTQTVHAQFVDFAGNKSAVATDTIIVDTAAPSGTLTVRRGAVALADGYTNSGRVTLDFTSTDTSAQVKVANSSAALQTAPLLAYQTPLFHDLDIQAEGPKTVHAKLVDAAGNESNALTASIHYDITAPSPVSLRLLSAAHSNDAGVTLELLAQDNHAGASGLSSDAAVILSELFSFTGPTTVGPSAMPASGVTVFATSSDREGPRSIYASYRDVAGNSAVAEVSMTFDTTAPSGSFELTGALSDGTPSTVATAQTTVSLVLSQVGASRYHKADGVLAACPTSDASYTALAGQTSLAHTLSGTSGAQAVSLCLRDEAGNTLGPLNDTITLDTSAITGCALALEALQGNAFVTSSYSNTTNIRARISGCSETPGELALFSGDPVDCGSASLSWGAFTDPATLVLPSTPGAYEYSACVRDISGHTMALGAVSMTLDTQPPALTVALASTSPSRSATVEMTITASDDSNALGPDALTASEDPTFAPGGTTLGPQAVAPSINFTTSSGDGQKRIYVRLQDRAGNQTLKSVDVELDQSAPSAVVTINGALGDGSASSTGSASTAVTVAISSADATGYLLMGEGVSTCPAVSGATYLTLTSTNPSTTLLGTTSPRSVAVCLRDLAGNVTAAPVVDTIAFDGVGPSGCALSLEALRAGVWNADGYSNATSIRAVVASCLEAPAEMALTVGTAAPDCASPTLGWTSYSTPSALTLPSSDGSHDTYLCVRDAARNGVRVGPDSITLDRDPPVFGTVSITGAPITTNATEDVTVTASDTPNTLTGLADALTISEDVFYQAAPIVGPKVLDADPTAFTFSSGDGTKTLYIRLRDRAGNEAYRTLTLQTDNVAPAPTMEITGTLADGEPSQTLTSSSTVQVTLGASDAVTYRQLPVATAACPTDATTGFVAIPSQLSLPLEVSNGTGTMKLCLADAAGNVGGPFTKTITVDSSAPAGCNILLRALRHGTYVSNSYTASTNIRVGLSGCLDSPTELATREGSVTDCTDSTLDYRPLLEQDLTLADSGPLTRSIGACVRDAAKNAIFLSAADITLDTDPPSNLSVAVNGAVVTNASSVVLSISAADTGGFGASDGLTVSESLSFAGAVLQSFDGAEDVTHALSTSDGAKTVYVRVRDEAGNESIGQVVVTRDTDPPKASEVTLTIVGKLADTVTESTEVTQTTAVSVRVAQSRADVASKYAVVTGSTSCTDPALVYGDLPADGVVTATLDTTLSPPNVKLCLMDAAGNVTASSLTDSNGIAYDADDPTSCVLTVVGLRADGSDAGQTKTAHSVVSGFLSGCSADTTQFFLAATSSAGCSETMSASWSDYVDGVRVDVVLPGSDGLKDVSGCVRDGARNVAALAVKNITLDTTGPLAYSLSINNGEEFINRAAWTASGLDVSVSATATGASQWALSDDEAAFANPQPFSGTSGTQAFTLADAGVQTVYGIFWDEVGNPSAVLSDQIIVDIEPPAVGSIEIKERNGYGFIKSTSVSVGQTPSSEAVGIQLAENVGLGCLTTLQAASEQPLTQSYPLTVSPAEVPKEICARWTDEASNYSAIATANAVLDSTPPSQPLILTAAKIFNPGADLTQEVVISLDTKDARHGAWELLGGADHPTWGAAAPILPPGPDAGIASFTFELQVSDAGAAERGLPNVLRIRELDQAGNASGEGSVVITTDIVPPQGVRLNNFWTDNGNGESTLYWHRSRSGDIAGYNIYYGAAPGTPAGTEPTGYVGSYAAQGPSPVRMGNVNRATLSNLPNAAMTFATVRPVDFAGNIGFPPEFMPQEVSLQPGEVSANLIASLDVFAGVPLGAPVRVERVAVNGSYAYVAGVQGACGAKGFAHLQVVDLSRLASPLTTELLDGGAPPPIRTGQLLSYEMSIQCIVLPNGVVLPPMIDLAVEGPWLFLAAGSELHIFTLNRTSKNGELVEPELYATIDFSVSTASWPFSSTQLVALDVKGEDAFIAAEPNHLIRLSLASLYDEDGSTRPVRDSVTAMSSATTANPTGLAWTHDKVLVTGVTNDENADGDGRRFEVAGGDATAFGPVMTGLSYSHANPLVSGNLMLHWDDDSLTVSDLSSIWSGVVTDGGTTFPLVAAAGWAGTGRQEMAGSQIILNDPTAPGVHVVELDRTSGLRETGYYRNLLGAQALSSATYGPYLLQGTANGRLLFYELGTPRGLHTRGSAPGEGARIDVGNGLIYTASGVVYDLTDGANPVLLNATLSTQSETCAADFVRFDDVVVTSYVERLDFKRTEKTSDRNPLTQPDSDDTSQIYLAAEAATTSLERYGNYLVLGQVRSDASAAPGLWLSIYDARSLRSGKADGKIDLTADFIADVQVSSAYYGDEWIDLNITSGFAVVTLESAAAPAGSSSVFFLDLRSYFNDEGKVGSNTVLQGEVSLDGFSLPAVREGVIQGRYVYLAAADGFYVLDATPLTDGDPDTLMKRADVVSFTPLPEANSLAVFGALALVTPYGPNATGITAFDLTDPAAPRRVGYYPYRTPSPLRCSSFGGSTKLGDKELRTSTIIRGSRAYIGSNERLDILELE